MHVKLHKLHKKKHRSFLVSAWTQAQRLSAQERAARKAQAAQRASMNGTERAREAGLWVHILVPVLEMGRKNKTQKKT